MEVLARSRRRNIRRGHELQERLCGRTNQGRIDLIQHSVELILLPRPWIENLDRLAVVVCRLGKISIALVISVECVICRHSRERIIRVAPARTIPSAEKEPFVPPVEILLDIQRSAHVNAETRLVVIRLRRLNAGQRIWPRIQSRVIVREIQHPMRLIDVEALRHSANHDHSAAGPAKTATPASKATAAFALHAIAKLLDPFLQILLGPAAEVLRPSLRAADAYRLSWPLCSRSV